MFGKKSLHRFSVITILIISVAAFICVNATQADVFYEDFSANVTEQGTILLEWWTDTEVNNQAFYIQRSLTQSGVYGRLESSYTLSASQGGEGGYYYFYEDANVVVNQIYYYRVEAIDIQGRSSVYGPINVIIRDSSTPTPTVTGTITNQPSTPTATPTRVGSIGTITPTFTRTVTTPPGPGVTVTSRVTDDIINTPDPNLTTTATFTKTFEPLPTIELILPVSPTISTQRESQIATQDDSQLQPVDADAVNQSIVNVSSRITVLMGIVALLWLCLGILLVYMVRRLN